MSKNIIIFNHHYESQPGEWLLNSLEILGTHGFDTLCIEAAPSQKISKELIEISIKYKEELKNRIEKELDFKYGEKEIDIEELSEKFYNSSLPGEIDIRTLFNLPGDTIMLQVFKKALQMQFEICGIEFPVSQMTTSEVLRTKNIREKTQFEELSKLNKKGKNCVVMTGASHFEAMRKNIASLPLDEQENYKLIYVYTDTLLDERLKSQEWYELRQNPLPAKYFQNPPMHCFNISTVQSQNELTTWLKELLSKDNKSKESLYDNLSTFFSVLKTSAAEIFVAKKEEKPGSGTSFHN